MTDKPYVSAVSGRPRCTCGGTRDAWHDRSCPLGHPSGDPSQWTPPQLDGSTTSAPGEAIKRLRDEMWQVIASLDAQGDRTVAADNLRRALWQLDASAIPGDHEDTP